MEDDTRSADLVLVLGTSLGGLNADQVATECAARSLRRGPRESLGTVCINLQQTEQDGKMTLRLFGRSDDVLARLLPKLGLPMPRRSVLRLPTESRMLVPYDAEGRRLPEDSKARGRSSRSSCISARLGSRVTVVLGMWWLDAADRGAVDVLPVVSITPEFAKEGCSPAGSAK